MIVHPGRNCKEMSPPVWFPTGRMVGVLAVLLLVVGAIAAADQPTVESSPIVSSQKYPGYQSLWYSHTPDWKGEVIPGRSYEYGPKQDGGLGTYQAVHIPRAIYAPEVQKTFFAYGGTKQDQRHLLAMASYFDHRTGLVPQPTIVHDKQGVDDAHDNPVITLDEDGHVWVFVAGRSRHRPGFIYRSIEPYSCGSTLAIPVVASCTLPAVRTDKAGASPRSWPGCAGITKSAMRGMIASSRRSVGILAATSTGGPTCTIWRPAFLHIGTLGRPGLAGPRDRPDDKQLRHGIFLRRTGRRVALHRSQRARPATLGDGRRGGRMDQPGSRSDVDQDT